MGKKKQTVNPVWERKKNAIMRNYHKMVNEKKPKVPQRSIDNEMDTTAESLESEIQEIKKHDRKFFERESSERSIKSSNRSLKNVDEQESIIIAPAKFKQKSVASKEKNAIKNKSKSYLSMREKANVRVHRYRVKLTEDQKQAKKEMDKQRYYEKKVSGLVKNISSKSEKQKKNQRKTWREASKKYQERKKLMSQLLNNSSNTYELNFPTPCSTTTISEHSDSGSDESFPNIYSTPITFRNSGDSTFPTTPSSLSIRKEQGIKRVKTIRNKSKSYLLMREKANARVSRYRAKLTEDQKQAKREMDKQHYYERKALDVIKNISSLSKSEKEKRNQRKQWKEASKKYRERKKEMSQLLINSLNTHTHLPTQCSTTAISEHSDNDSDQSFPYIYDNPITSGASTFLTTTSSLSIRREQGIKCVKRIKNTIKRRSKSYLLMREKANARVCRCRAKITEDQKRARREMDKQCYYKKKGLGVIKKLSSKSEKEKNNQRKRWREVSRKYRKRKISQLFNNSSNTYFLMSYSSSAISAHSDSGFDQSLCNDYGTSISFRNSSASAFSTTSSALSFRREQGINRVKTIRKNVYRQLEKQKRINKELKRELDKYKKLVSLKNAKIIELRTNSLEKS